MSGLRVILCGYHEVGQRVLEHLAARDDVAELYLFTHRPGFAAPDLRPVAEGLGVGVTTASINKVAALPFPPDVIAVVYYRYIIKAPVIRACSGRIFNLHPSLLPRHRGCSSVTWAMVAGDAETGITFHYIDEDVDTGRIVVQARLPIPAEATQDQLYEACMDLGARRFPDAFQRVLDGHEGTVQTGPSCHHPRGVPHDGAIGADWSRARVARFIRAMTWPGLPGATWQGQPVDALADYLRLRPDAPVEGRDLGCE